MATMHEIKTVVLAPSALKAKGIMELADSLGHLDYGESVALDAHIAYLNLIDSLTGQVPFRDQSLETDLLLGINKLFHSLSSSLPSESTPFQDQNRESMSLKISNGYKLYSEILKAELDANQITTEAAYKSLYLVAGTSQSNSFARIINLQELLSNYWEKYQLDSLGLTLEKDNFKNDVNTLLLFSRLSVLDYLGKEFINKHFPNESWNVRAKYRNIFDEVICDKFELSIDLPPIENRLFDPDHKQIAKRIDEYLAKKDVGNKILKTFVALFKDKVMSNRSFYYNYLTYEKQVYNKNSLIDSEQGLMTYLHNDVFDGNTRHVKRNAILRMLLDFGYAQTKTMEVPLERLVPKLRKEGEWDVLLDTLKELPEESWHQQDMVELLSKKNHEGASLLYSAVVNQKLALVKFLLEKGSDPNAENIAGITPLICASNQEDIAIAEELIRRGADVNLPGNDGNSPLITASQKGNMELVKLLIENHAKLDHQNDANQTALMKAVGGGFQHIAKALIEQGASLDLQCESGLTALMIAVKANNTAMVELLVSAGSSLEIEDFLGRNALSFARTYGDSSMERLLNKRQIDPEIQTRNHIVALEPKRRNLKPPMNKANEAVLDKRPRNFDS